MATIICQNRISRRLGFLISFGNSEPQIAKEAIAMSLVGVLDHTDVYRLWQAPFTEQKFASG
jgi:hypothetical protein